MPEPPPKILQLLLRESLPVIVLQSSFGISSGILSVVLTVLPSGKALNTRSEHISKMACGVFRKLLPEFLLGVLPEIPSLGVYFRISTEGLRKFLPELLQ